MKDKQDYIWGKRKNKTIWIIIIAVVVVLAAAVLGYLFLGQNNNTNKNTGLVNISGDHAEKAERKIDGVLVPKDQANLYPVAVMIENMVSSRPQSSLSEANLVYEALAEGGITRFMAIYAGSGAIPKIGPVRSARSYYLDWAKELNALYAHIGGSPQSFNLIKQYKILDLDQFFNAQYFWRNKDRPAPHNLYTSSELLAYALRDKQLAKEGNYESWSFKDDKSKESLPTEEKNIIIDFSSFNYKVEYKYESASNEYLRYQAGQPHQDEEGHQIKAKNIAIQYLKTSLVDKERLGMETIGEGEAVVFQDGQATKGTWKKESRESRTKFYNSDGEKIQFNRGNTWLEIVPSGRTVSYN